MIDLKKIRKLVFNGKTKKHFSDSETERVSITTITGPDPAKFTESTEGSGQGLQNLSENDGLSVPECSSRDRLK